MYMFIGGIVTVLNIYHGFETPVVHITLSSITYVVIVGSTIMVAIFIVWCAWKLFKKEL